MVISGVKVNAKIDVKLVGSSNSRYTTTVKSDANKMAAAERGSVTCTLAINNGPNKADHGVYVKLGPGSFTAKEGPRVVRLMSREELKTLSTPAGQKLLKDRFQRYIHNVDLKEYRAIMNKKAKDLNRKASEDLNQVVEVGKKFGISKKAQARRMAETMSQDAAEVAATAAAQVNPEVAAIAAAKVNPEVAAQAGLKAMDEAARVKHFMDLGAPEAVAKIMAQKAG